MVIAILFSLLATTQAEQATDLADTEEVEPAPIGDPWGTQKTVGAVVNDDPKSFTVDKPGNSAVEKSVLVDIVEGRQPAKHYKLTARLKSEHLFDLVTILQNLPDKSVRMDIDVTVTAYAKDQFDLTCLI